MTQSRPRPTTCAYCGGPLPAPAVTGRPRTFCSAQCRRANEFLVISRNREEMQRREKGRIEAERKAREKRAARKAEREYQRALQAGGRVALEAAWWQKSDELADAGGRYELCQWEEEIEGEYTHVCMRRTTDVYCRMHDRQLERESLARMKGESS
jgi:hypothetical protein